MRIVLAPNAFKESLSAWEVCQALAAGLRSSLPEVECVLAPMADGGDGTMDTLVRGTGGRRASARVHDPLGREIRAGFGLLGDGSEAVVEMAAASGLRLLKPEERDPMRASTLGVGELILAAARRGARRIVIGVGGSATVDGGTGMARALGWRFLDAKGRELSPCGKTLAQIVAIDASAYQSWREGPGRDIEVVVACDVSNPLLGKSGAARVFGPQKGASPDQVVELEAGLANLADIELRELGIRMGHLKGGGAAGGLAAGLVAFCGARLEPGAPVIAVRIGLEEKLADADWAITGEGRLDGQTIFGKAPAHVAELAVKKGVPVIAVAGSVATDAGVLYSKGVRAMFSICDGPMSLETAKTDARRLVQRLGRALGGVIRNGK
jgi:glycerate kinase